MTIRLLWLTTWLAAMMALSPLASANLMCLGSPGVDESHARYLEQQVVMLDREARQAYSELPWQELHVGQAQQALGRDPGVIFEWVRDQTRWLPYAGALRGAKGVMQDRSGSSLDRALLLVALMEEAGQTVRLARSAMTDEARVALHRAWSHQPVATRPERDLDVAEERKAIEQVAQRFDLDTDELSADYFQQNDLDEQLAERLKEQTLRQHAALREALRPDLEESPGESVGETVGEIVAGDRVIDHWWVEWRSEEGWISLDPALPDHALGDLLVMGSERSHYYPEDLPEEVRHWLTIEVVAERLEDGRLQEEVAFSHRLPATELMGQQLQLETHPLNLPSQQSLLDGGEALTSLTSQLLEEEQWLPYLRFGDSLERQKLINADGSVEDPRQQTGTSAAFGEASSALGEIGLTGRTREASAPAELTAVMARFHVEAPGRGKDTFERPMMDLLGPGQRAAGGNGFEVTSSMREQRAAALLGTFELLGQTSWLTPSQQAAWRYEMLLENRQASLGVAYAATHGDFSFMGDTLESRAQRRIELDQLAGLRLAYSPYLEDIALTRLNLLGYVSLVDYQDGTLQRREGFDILDNRVEVPSGESVSSTKLAQGVLDTLLEAELLAAETAPRSNAATAFGHDLAQQRHWQHIDHVDAVEALDWQPGADLNAHFKAVLAQGHTLVVPNALTDGAVPTWWQLDPGTGDLLGYGPDRRGQFVEGLLMLMHATDAAMGAVQMVQLIWDCLLTSDDPHCCTRTAAANAAITKMAGKGLAAAAHAQRVNLVIGRSIVHGRTFRKLNEAAVGNVAGRAGGVIAGAATSAVGCS